jgi:hypothetical protein
MTRHHPTWTEVRPYYIGAEVPYDATCTTCRWYRSHREDDSLTDPGDCRRHAPSFQSWPVVSADDYCGDWQTDYYPVDRNGDPCEAEEPAAPV